jgi:hypothetical protein
MNFIDTRTKSSRDCVEKFLTERAERDYLNKKN